MDMMIYIFIGFGLGIFAQILFHRLSTNAKNKKIIDDVTKQFSEILQNILSNKAIFKSRVNQTVYITTNIKDYGDVDLLYLMDKNDVGIFKDNNCIYTTHVVEGQVIKDILSSIDLKFGKDINNTIEVSGITLSKGEFEKIFSVDIKEIERQQQSHINKIQEEQKSDIEKLIESNSKKLSLDDILDKIGKVGFVSLTDEEKEFLKNQ